MGCVYPRAVGAQRLYLVPYHAHHRRVEEHPRTVYKHHGILRSKYCGTERIKHSLLSVRQTHLRVSAVILLAAEQQTSALPENTAVGKHLLPSADHTVKTRRLHPASRMLVQKQVQHLIEQQQSHHTLKLGMVVAAHKWRTLCGRLIKHVDRSFQSVGAVSTIQRVKSRDTEHRHAHAGLLDKTLGKPGLTRTVCSYYYNAPGVIVDNLARRVKLWRKREFHMLSMFWVSKVNKLFLTVNQPSQRLSTMRQREIKENQDSHPPILLFISPRHSQQAVHFRLCPMFITHNFPFTS